MSRRQGGPQAAASVPRIVSKDQADAIARKIFAMAQGGGETRAGISSWWDGELHWALNRANLSSDRRDIRVTVQRFIRAVAGAATTNQLDDTSLAATVRAAERAATLLGAPQRPPKVEPPIPILPWPRTAVWSDATFDLATPDRDQIVHRMIEPVQAKGMLSFGYLEVRGGSTMRLSSLRPDGPYPPWDEPYVAWTQGQCSLTVRDPGGAGSGWAGLSSYDWKAMDPEALGARALQKCLASRNPVAIEPGRYTVVLEPQAVADLLQPIPWFRQPPEMSAPPVGGPWALGYDDALELFRSKLGLKVADSRITISHDPSDPQLGILPLPGMEPVTWIDHGVLTSLAYNRPYALSRLNANTALRTPIGYRMSGGPTTMDEMIATTQRGLLVTRFTDIRVLEPYSVLCTGLTRDGLWLIENGKISKAVKNFRFTESPLFVLNSVDQLGEPVPVFRPVKNPYNPELTPAIVPPIKARDFSFTSLIDAI